MWDLVVAALLSGAVVSTTLGLFFHGRLKRLEQEIISQRAWKERSTADLLGPVNIQLDRTQRAFNRWTGKNLYLEAKVIREGNHTIRELLLEKSHLLPPELLEDAGRLIEHYDVWLEKFDQKRQSEKPDLETPFIFVGPDGYPFPRKSADRIQETYRHYWKELYEDE